MPRKMYLDFIRNAVKSDGLEIADRANKLALEKGAISQDLYLAAAKILVAEYMKR